MAHDHDHHHHEGASLRHLLVALALTGGFAIVEALGGWLSGSLALITDAGHMVTDASALGLAALASWLATRPPSPRHSYGFGRLEVLAALFNAVLMVTLVAAIAVAAVERFTHPRPVEGEAVTVVAAIGLVVNILVAWVLAHDSHNLNVRAALLHVLGDLLGSVAALISGVVILATGWMPIDPLLSVLIALLILRSSLALLRDALNALLDGVPRHLDFDEVGHAMAGIDGVKSVHDLHIWSLSAERVALSAHVMLSDMKEWCDVLDAERAMLHKRFGIDHLTLQPEIQTPVLGTVVFHSRNSID